MTGAGTLSAIFATILPGDDLYPSASSLPMAERSRDYPHFVPAITRAVGALPPNFASLTPQDRACALRDLETREPDLMFSLVTAAYSLYYSDEAVLKVISQTENYTPRAPQPEGYRLDPFDPGMVANPSRQAPSWRSTEQTHGS